MHRDVDDALQNGRDSLGGFLTFFVFEKLVPEGMGKKIQANTGRASLEKP